jgi:hypothetical protein
MSQQEQLALIRLALDEARAAESAAYQTTTKTPAACTQAVLQIRRDFQRLVADILNA